MRMRVLFPALALALVGCGEDPKPTGGSADGEILPGSLSDAMLPLDTVRSQPPLAPRAAEGGKEGEKEVGKDSDARAQPKRPEPRAASAPPAKEQAATAADE